MRIINITIAVSLLTAFLTGCFGNSSPTESDARSVLENQFGKRLQDGTIRINSFKKVNGLSREIAGTKVYTLEYEAEIEYPNGQNAECAEGGRLYRKMACWASSMKPIKVGEIIKNNKEIVFTLTENGWRGPDKNIY